MIGSYHISTSAIRNVGAEYCLGHVYGAADTEAKCACCAGCRRHSACQPERDELLYSMPSKDSQSSASLQLLISQTAHGFAKIERKPLFTTIPLDCCTRSPPVLPEPASQASAEATLFYDKGPALGRILLYCGLKSVQWAGWRSEDAAVAECRPVSRCSPECSDSDPDSVV